MNRIIANRGRALPGFLLALLILLSCACALGEPGPGQKDYGDFTLTFPAGCHLQEGLEGEALFTLFPEYDAASLAHANLNCVRSSEVRDFSGLAKDQLLSLAEAEAPRLQAAMEAQGLIVENMKAVSAELTSLNGKTALACAYAMDVDYSKLGREMKPALFIKQYILSDSSLKTCVFTLTGFSEKEIKSLDRLLQECVAFK